MEQNYKNYTRIVPVYHYVTLLAILAVTIGSFVNLSNSWRNHNNLYSASLICVITLILSSFYWFIRSFPLRAQDRAIRAEENLRHFVFAGKMLDPRLRIGQIIALRFASDEEFVELARRAAEENIGGREIKKIIKSWRADHYRV